MADKDGMERNLESEMALVEYLGLETYVSAWYYLSGFNRPGA